MKSKYSQETKEIITISFTNFLLGICVILGGLAFYKNFTPINTGGVFYSFVGLLSFSLLAGIGILIFRKNNTICDLLTKTYARISQPAYIVGIITFSSILLLLVHNFASHSYPFLRTQTFSYGTALALFGLYSLISAAYLIRLKAWIIKQINGLKDNLNFINNHAFIGVLLFCAILFTYRNSFSGALLRLDDLFMIDFARDESIFTAITKPPEVYSVFYRPMHNLVLWIYYHLFGFDYAKYQFAELFGHIVVVLLLYAFLHSLTKEKLIPAILALAFGTHIYISVGIVYVNAVFWWLGVFGIIAFIGIANGRKLRWYSWWIIVAVLLLTLLLGEYGFAIIGAMWLLAFYIFVFDRDKDEIKYATSLTITGLIVVIIYFTLRWQAVGIIPESGGGSSGYFWGFYQDPRSLGLKFTIYTIVANLISTFVPIFSQSGVLLLPPIIQITSGIIIFYIYLTGLQKIKEDSINGYLWLPMLFIFLFGSKEIVKHLIGNYNLSLTFSLHTILNFAIAFVVVNWKEISRQHKSISLFAVGLILGSSIVAFSYFRWRTHYYSFMGWVILISIGINYLRRIRNGRIIITSLLIITMLMSWKSMKIIDSRLPVIKVEEFQENICDDRVSKDLAIDISSYYNITSESILKCISEKEE